MGRRESEAGAHSLSKDVVGARLWRSRSARPPSGWELGDEERRARVVRLRRGRHRGRLLKRARWCLHPRISFAAVGCASRASRHGRGACLERSWLISAHLFPKSLQPDGVRAPVLRAP